MAAFDFPASPTDGQQYTANGVTYVWDAANQIWKGGAPAVIANTFMNLPAGMVFQWLADAVPAGCLELNGQLISRTTYSNLFAIYGTKYGAGDGSTSFGLPNTVGAAFVGKDGTGTRLQSAYGFNATAVGTVFGGQAITLAIGEVPAHAHLVTDHTHQQVGHQHSIAYSNATAIATSGSGFVRGAATGFSTLFTTVDGGGNSTGTMNGGAPNSGNAGGGSWHGNVQPSMVALHVVTTGGQ